MAGRGAPPKPASRRARTNADPIPLRSIELVRDSQPDLPDAVVWHPQTVTWWRMWGASALAKDFTASDWSFLLDTAVLHTQHWSGDPRAAAELRLRVAKFGATPEDRARLRITFADADERDEKRSAGRSSARERYGGRVVSAVASD